MTLLVSPLPNRGRGGGVGAVGARGDTAAREIADKGMIQAAEVVSSSPCRGRDRGAAGGTLAIPL